jgi:putative ABC transport system permease protein
VIGKPIVVERVPFTVVGVTPPGFFGAEVGRTFDLALPMNAEPLIRGAESRINPQRGYFALTVLLRLKSGQSVDTATAILRGIQPQIREAAMPAALPPPFRQEFLKDAFTVVPAATGTSQLRVRYERPLIVILAVVSLVLLVACANIANLQIARAIARRHDLSLRFALGASRWRLARESLVESLLLSAGGTASGLPFAFWSSRLLVARLSTPWTTFISTCQSTGAWLRSRAGSALRRPSSSAFFRRCASAVAPIDALKEQGRGSSRNSSGRWPPSPAWQERPRR